MRYIIALITLQLLLSNAGKCQQSPAEQVADRIAVKMRDSLSLSGTQKDSLYAVNMYLHYQKQAARQPQVLADSLPIFIQRIENKRDSLYRRVLSEEKYLLYLQKKTSLINNN